MDVSYSVNGNAASADHREGDLVYVACLWMIGKLLNICVEHIKEDRDAELNIHYLWSDQARQIMELAGIDHGWFMDKLTQELEAVTE